MNLLDSHKSEIWFSVRLEASVWLDSSQQESVDELKSQSPEETPERIKTRLISKTKWEKIEVLLFVYKIRERRFIDEL